MSGYILKKIAALLIPNAPAGKVIQFVNETGALMQKDETGAVREVGGGAGDGDAGGVSVIDFATALPLSQDFIMTQHAVAATVAFTMAEDRTPGKRGYLRLLADGVSNVTFTGMKEWGGSLGYDNRAGIVNSVDVFYDGTDAFYSFSQAVGASPTPTVAGAPTNVVATAGDKTAAVTFAAPLNNGNSVITGYTVHASTGETADGAASPITVAGLDNGTAVTFTVVAHNAIGDSAASAASNAVTPAAAGNALRLTNLDANTVESGSPGAYSYAGSGLGFGSGVKMGGILNAVRKVGTAGSIQFSRAGANSEIFVGFTDSATPVFMNALPAAMMSSFEHGWYVSMSYGNNNAQSNDNLTILNGDRERLSWGADLTTATSAVSKDGGATWTDLYTWTGLSPSLVHIQMSVASQPGTISQISGVGLT